MKLVCFSVILFLFTTNGYAQDCDITIRGKVIDEATNLPLSFVNILIQEEGKGATTDDDGNFLFTEICNREYHVLLSHIGCEPQEIHLFARKDTTIIIELAHTSVSLIGVTIEAKKDNHSSQPSISINRQLIEDNSTKNLSGLLENETGVAVIKNGAGIGKPVVHGMFGNRLTILNNGIAQSGQQWGNDHSPEIDPLSADKITVLKGASALEYGSGNLGGLILIEPKKIGRVPHLHGRANYAFESNGRGNNINVQLQKYSPLVAWKINGTYKRYGDRKTATYFLNNTGLQEANFSTQLEKSWNDKLFVDFYASTFNTTIGVLRGSHIGNLTDLENALNNDIPYYTEENFSYKIDAPRQKVSHHLIKLKTKYYFDDHEMLELTLATQINDRKEFDIRRGGRTNIPAMSLRQYTHNIEWKYDKHFENDWKLKIGNQNILTDNTNNPETGILPLIPDYFSSKNGVYTTLSKEFNKTDFNIGIRYDYEWQDVVTLTRRREIIRYNNQYHNVSGIIGFKQELSNTQTLAINTGLAMRNPAINELYSNGLHQGVSGIEEGDVNLNTEKAIKTTLEYKLIPSTKFSFNALMYYQYLKDYMFLNPQDEIRLTIRGAFPVFRYEQTDAGIYGLDLSTQFSITNSLAGVIKYSFIRGSDLKNDLPLINMPANSLFGSFSYRLNKLNISSLKFEDLEFELENRLVFRQNHLLEEQDFVRSPNMYNLIGTKVSTNVVFKNQQLRLYTKVDNLLNTKYRDYLNRQRYFADDVGISVTIGANLKF